MCVCVFVRVSIDVALFQAVEARQRRCVSWWTGTPGKTPEEREAKGNAGYPPVPKDSGMYLDVHLMEILTRTHFLLNFGSKGLIRA